MEKWKKFTAFSVERLLPYIVTLVGFIYFYCIKVESIVNFKDILVCNVTFASIIIGFLTTMLSILVASSDKPVVKRLKEKNKLKLLNWIITIPIIVGFISIVSSFFLIPYSDSKMLYTIKLFYFFIALTILFISTAIRAIVIMVVFINYSDEGEDKQRELDVKNSF